MDEADLAQGPIEAVVEAGILAARRRAGPAAVGYCLNCGEPLPDGRRWCNRECRDDWCRREDA